WTPVAPVDTRVWPLVRHRPGCAPVNSLARPEHRLGDRVGLPGKLEVMMSTQVSSATATQTTGAAPVPLRLEVVTLPVTDVDRAKSFYLSLGWRLDADISAGDDFRVVQVTPPQSQASIHFGKGLTTAEPGSVVRLYLAVDDINAAREDLIARGAKVSEVFHYDRGPG